MPPRPLFHGSTAASARPVAAAASGPAIPLLNLSTTTGAGGTLTAGQTLYYAVSGVDASGAEGRISFIVRATILSGGMMLDHLGMHDAARDVEAAVAAVLAESKARTPDIGGHSSTEEVTEAVLEKLG